MSKGTLLGLLAETPLHPGAGQAEGVVDLPIAREGATGLPQIPDTGLKGALRQWSEEEKALGEEQVKRLFGAPEDGAGQLMISSARLLCLPVRRLDGAYAWVTTPYLLERLRRDSARCGHSLDLPNPQPKGGDLPELFTKAASEETIFLGEFTFKEAQYDDFAKVQNAIAPLLPADENTKTRVLSQLAIMSDDEFAWFAGNALPVNARNVLDKNKMSENLWYEEVIPPDALFYTMVLPRNKAAEDGYETFLNALTKGKYLQVGGNETVGQGWVQVARYPCGDGGGK